MTERHKRPKASEVFKTANLPFARKAGFEEAFPTVEDVTVQVEIHDLGAVQDVADKRTYSKENLGEYLDCTNPICYNGGVCLGDVLRQMVDEGATQLSVSKYCQGYEGSAGGRRKYRDCLKVFRLNIDLAYKAGQKPSTEANPT